MFIALALKFALMVAFFMFMFKASFDMLVMFVTVMFVRKKVKENAKRTIDL